MKRFFVFLILSLLGLNLISAADGSIFTAKTIEGIDMQFVVLSESQKVVGVYGKYEHKHVMTKQDGTKVYKDFYYTAIADDYSGEITIPENVNGYTVTTIDNYAFYKCNLSSISIPKTIHTRPYSSSFAACANLTTVFLNSNDIVSWSYTYNKSLKDYFGTQVSNYVLGNDVTSIGKYAFYNCKNLKSFTIPNSVVSIDDAAFSGCDNLTSIIIPKNVKSITGNPFSNLYLQSIIVDNENQIYDSRNNCNAIIETSTNRIIVGCTNTIIPDDIISIGEKSFESCSNLISVSIPNSVTTIEKRAFYSCSNLVSVSIGNNVSNIGESAFYDCKALTNITIPNSVHLIDRWAFGFCEGLTSLTIGNQVYKIEQGAFENCYGLKTIVLPNSITSIESFAFSDCQGLTSVTLGNSVTYLGQNVFSGCSSLTSIELPNSVESIGYEAFGNCRNLKTIILGDNIQLFNDYTFQNCDAKLYVNRKTSTLLNLWKGGYNAFEIGTEKQLLAPSVTCILTGNSASSFSAKIEYNENDGFVSKKYWEINGEIINSSTISYKGLNPNTSYSLSYTIQIKSNQNDDNSYDETNSISFSTEALTLKTKQPKVVSLGNVIVSAEANIDDEEKNVGFEWRRTDWTDDFASNTGTANMVEGTMEGYIRNLNTEKLWKFRPYYLSDSGTYYYGEWIGLDPTNTSYFEPTVHTYAKIEVKGNTALVKGYALGGSDEVTVQGFKYWKSAGGGSNRVSSTDIPDNAKTIEASGTVMEVSLSDLDYDSSYSYVAFATTSKGTYYGEIKTFETGNDPTGINTIKMDNTSTEGVHEIARFNMQGRRIATPEKGINIVKMSDGTTKKVLVK